MDKKERLDQLHKKMIAEIQDYAIILLDIDGTILSWNIGAEKIKGYKVGEIIGQNFPNILFATGQAIGIAGTINRPGNKGRPGTTHRPSSQKRWLHLLGKHSYYRPP